MNAVVMEHGPLIPVKQLSVMWRSWYVYNCYKHMSMACIQISDGNIEEGLEQLLDLPPNSINNTQRLVVLKSAFLKHSEIKERINESIAQVDL